MRYPLSQYDLVFGKGLFSLVFWENISVSYLPLNCLPLKRFVYVLLINARYASFETLENEKCKTPAHIYSSKKLIHCRQWREITDPTHFFWNIVIKFAKSFFYENPVFNISSERIFWHYNFFSVKVLKNFSNVKKKRINKWKKNFKHKHDE